MFDADGVPRVAEAARLAFPYAVPDILCIDPIRSMLDGGPDGAGENDNGAMMFFLRERIDALREAVAPDCGFILAHHTKKLTNQQVKDDPFLALAGASALRGYYTSGTIMHVRTRSAPSAASSSSCKTARRCRRNSSTSAAGAGWKSTQRRNAWCDRSSGRSSMPSGAAKPMSSSAFFSTRRRTVGCTHRHSSEGIREQGRLGSQYTIRDRIGVLARKGFIKFRRDGTAFGLSTVCSRSGYLYVEGMRFGRASQIVPGTGEVPGEGTPVPSHSKCPQSGAAVDVENPAVWFVPTAPTTEGAEDLGSRSHGAPISTSVAATARMAGRGEAILAGRTLRSPPSMVAGDHRRRLPF